MKNSFLPTVENSLKYCIFLIEVEIENYNNDNREYVSEARRHKDNLTQLLKLMNESEETIMEMSKKSYEQAEKVFGKALAARLFANVKIIDGYVAPTNAEALFKAIKVKGVASRSKEVKPAGFFTENAAVAFESALFSRKSANGYKDGRKDWPKVATTFSELRQARIEGELAEQFTMLTQNILQSSEFNASVKAEKLAALASEYSRLSRGEN